MSEIVREHPYGTVSKKELRTILHMKYKQRKEAIEEIEDAQAALAQVEYDIKVLKELINFK